MVLHFLPHRRLLRLIGRAAEEELTRAYLVGGPLRDILLGKRITDLDIAVEDRVKPVGRRLGRLLRGEVVFYPEFNTGTVRVKKGLSVDLAQTRQERYPEPAALPRVSPADIIVDLRRRDFTVNAMALDLSRRQFGMLLDPYGGFSDLLGRRLRVLHPTSFIDDPTRIFRAVKFAARLGFAIDPDTRRLMGEAVARKVVNRLSGERVLRELDLVCGERDGAEVLRRLGPVLRQLGFRTGTEFFLNFGLLPIGAQAERLLVLFSRLPDRSKYPLTREMARAIGDLRSFPRREPALRRARTPSQVYRILKPVDPAALSVLRSTRAVAVRRKIDAYRERYAKIRIATGGEDLKRLGIPPGKVYQEILDQLLALRLDRRIRSLSDERRWLREQWLPEHRGTICREPAC